jgi:glycosyltransferase involved in cell wall biosynthesis
MNILMVIGQYYPIIGGAEQQAQKLSEELVRQGHNVEIVTYTRRGLKKFELINGIKVFRLRGFLYKSIREYSLILSMLLFVWKRKNKYDLIHCHQALFPTFSAVIAGKLFNIPTIAKLGSSGSMFDLMLLGKNHLIGNLYVNYTINNINNFIAISSQIFDELKTFNVPVSKIKMIPNGIHIDKVKKNNNKKDIAFVGRLSKVKNIPFLIKIFNHLNIDSILNIYGNGDQKKEIQALIKHNNLENKIIIHGAKEQEDIKYALVKSSIFVLPSFTEGLSNALLEAMAYGVVPIVSDIPGNRYALGEELANILALPLDEQIWIDKINYLHNNPYILIELSKKVKERASLFDIKSITKQYVKLYEEIVN